MDVSEYCREIETYLCRKNDGHLIRVVGPSFELVSGWANEGIPLNVAFGGIDRYTERYYRGGPRRRPVRIDFCEADVRDVFDEWRRATGVVANAGAAGAAEDIPHRRGTSLPEHLERAIVRLTNARATGVLDERADPLIEQLSRELDLARAHPGGLRGEHRRLMIERLAAADASLTAIGMASLDQPGRAALEEEAAESLAPFRAAMAEDARARAQQAALERGLRARLGLPTIAFS